MAAPREFMSGRGLVVTAPAPEFRRRTELIRNTPALSDYSRKMWIRCEGDLAAAVAAELGHAPDDIPARAAARYVLEIPEFAASEPDRGAWE
jgi:MftR C-terminal domain